MCFQQQLAQMASQGTILTGQIQQGGTHTVVPQVVNQNGQQMPQLQHITVSAASHQHQPHQTQQLQPQLVNSSFLECNNCICKENYLSAVFKRYLPGNY